MSCAPKDLLALAREQAKGRTEAHRRSAVSRAYYASFHAASNWHARLPFQGDPGIARGEHERLIQQLMHPDRSCDAVQRKLSKWLAIQMGALRPLRIDADYRLEGETRFERAVHACAISSEVLDQVAEGP